MKTTEKYGKKADAALSLWVKLARAFSVVNKKSTENIRSFHLTEGQFGVVETLGHLGPMAVGDLCKKQLVSGGNMTVVLDNLERDGYIYRVREDSDRRSYKIELSPKGKELFEKIFPLHAEHIASIMSVLTDEETEELSRLLKKLGKSLI